AVQYGRLDAPDDAGERVGDVQRLAGAVGLAVNDESVAGPQRKVELLVVALAAGLVQVHRRDQPGQLVPDHQESAGRLAHEQGQALRRSVRRHAAVHDRPGAAVLLGHLLPGLLFLSPLPAVSLLLPVEGPAEEFQDGALDRAGRADDTREDGGALVVTAR